MKNENKLKTIYEVVDVSDDEISMEGGCMNTKMCFETYEESVAAAVIEVSNED
ncbi:MAG: hypothetical protein JKY80_02030 [Mariprofundaceae bacterium]|nr:hypothetical protein [Mariprofundaceae bacterium]